MRSITGSTMLGTSVLCLVAMMAYAGDLMAATAAHGHALVTPPWVTTRLPATPFLGSHISLPAVFAIWDAELSILDSGADRVRVEYRMAVHGAPASVSPFSFEGVSAAQVRGLFAGCVLGIPLHGEPTLTVVEAREVGRMPFPQGEGGFEHLDTSAPVIVGDSGFLRRQRVLQLGFGPRRSDDGSELILYDRIVADVHFEAGPRTVSAAARPAADRWGEIMYRHTVLNYEQARHWRARPSAMGQAPKAVQEPVADDLVKITIRHQGMYRITGADLREAGVAIEEIQPARMRLLYGGGRVMGLAVQVPRGIERREIAMIVEDGGDGRLDEEDFILFYGESAARWQYDTSQNRYWWRQNRYTKDNVYWLDPDSNVPGKRATMRSGAQQSGEPWRPTSYRERIHEEDERFILVQIIGVNSGYNWYWEDFQGNARNFSTIIRDAVAEDAVEIRVRFYGWSDNRHSFDIEWNGTLVGPASFTGSAPDTLQLTAKLGAQEGLNQLGIFHRDTKLTRLDWYELEYSRAFVADGGELAFSWVPEPEEEARADADGGTVAEFTLSGFGDGRPRIFETSISSELKEIVDFEFDAQTGEARFQDWFGGVGTPPRYLAVGQSRWRRPGAMVLTTATNLRSPENGAEYVVITHADFRAAAERLAEWRAQDDRFGEPLSTFVTDVGDIYAEFSGGMVDPMAIRSFVNYAVDNWDPAPSFIMLIGDGTYDYKNNSGTSHANWIPAYQDGESMYDEWYVRIEGEDRLPDLAIGRLPVQSSEQADALVDKLIAYDRHPEIGPWQTRVLLISDDLENPQKPENPETYFIHDAEVLASRLLPEDLDLLKLYIAQFPLEGRAKPQARDAFIQRFNEGALILTYLGHGNPNVLAHEQMFVLSRDGDAIDNGGRLPFMYTAASQVGVFDDPARSSMPEVLLNMAEGGVVGFISATRVGFHDTNMVLAYEFHRLMYRSGATHVPMGLALSVAKANIIVPSDRTGRGNVQRYSLLGDPAQRLARPRFSVEIEIADSLRALEEVPIQGHVLDPQGQLVADFTGQVWLQVFDSSVPSKLEGRPYEQIGAPLFRGLVPVTNGRFSAAFRIPKDISYKETAGRVSAYVWEADGARTAFGSVGGLVMAGTASQVTPDEDGPVISISFDGQQGFASGDFVSSRPLLTASVSDESGINITGETGHEIELRIDAELHKVTDSFSNIGGDYRIGVVEFQLPELEPGTHTIRLKVWDTFNNSAVSEAQMRVAEEGESVLSQVLFYPNPMQQGSGSFFTYTLSTPVESARIRVYTLAGKLIDDIDGGHLAGFNQVAWQPPADLANGSYLFNVEVAVIGGGTVGDTAVLQVVK